MAVLLWRGSSPFCRLSYFRFHFRSLIFAGLPYAIRGQKNLPQISLINLFPSALICAICGQKNLPQISLIFADKPVSFCVDLRNLRAKQSPADLADFRT
jgi:hypothetical protein